MSIFLKFGSPSFGTSCFWDSSGNRKDSDVVNLYDSDIKPIMNRKKLEMIDKSVFERRPTVSSLETVKIYK